MEKENKVSWVQLTGTRNRNCRDANGNYIYDSDGKACHYVERVFFTVVATESMAVRRAWLKDTINDCVGRKITLFMLGSTQEQEHYCFVYDHDKNVIYANVNNGTRHNEYVEFYKNATGATVEYVDTLPSVIRATRSSKVESLQDALNKAMNTYVDF